MSHWNFSMEAVCKIENFFFKRNTITFYFYVSLDINIINMLSKEKHIHNSKNKKRISWILHSSFEKKTFKYFHFHCAMHQYFYSLWNSAVKYFFFQFHSMDIPFIRYEQQITCGNDVGQFWNTSVKLITEIEKFSVSGWLFYRCIVSLDIWNAKVNTLTHTKRSISQTNCSCIQSN